MTIKTTIKCKNCGEKVIAYDTKGISYNAMCNECGWTSELDYYDNPETKKNELMTKAKAIKVGAIGVCKTCGQDMVPWEIKKYKDVCFFCVREG